MMCLAWVYWPPAEATVEVTGHDLVADAPVGPLRLAPGGSAVVRES